MGDAMYSTPFTQRHQSAYIFQDEVISNDTGMRHHGFVSNVNSAQTAAASDMDSSLSIGFTEDEGQANKLKGTIWPGMDLFDSATPDQKRKRNQRKDGAMIEQLKSTSEAVTATETVWNPEEGIHRVRDIYDSPSVEGSPPSTPSRKRKYLVRNSTPTDDDALEVAKEEDGDKCRNYGSSQQQRPVLQQLDPNLTIVEPTSCYKQSASARYGDGVRDSQHVAFRATQSSYGNGININGMGTNSTTLNHTSSQARSGSLYASLDNAMFNGNGDLGNEAPAATYHASSNRRLGFANLTMDSNNNSFEYNGKRECTLRESGFSDETYGNSTPLFDM
ncbi:hypothetical protein SPI_09164 [Niveomyces insectorum RCEF 264]|uniref:Uncharacterized protein n=1 Tax=Niveomyces insectorum RCEF 264 TaxID=1081102 RepID=A0A167M5L5_9HYPO|nr:hypothetical protein SPI_09164 [Niveomyces insectorum RCEF 264]